MSIMCPNGAPNCCFRWQLAYKVVSICVIPIQRYQPTYNIRDDLCYTEMTTHIQSRVDLCYTEMTTHIQSRVDLCYTGMTTHIQNRVDLCNTEMPTHKQSRVDLWLIERCQPKMNELRVIKWNTKGVRLYSTSSYFFIDESRSVY